MSDSAPPQTAPPIVIIHDNEKRDCMLQPFFVPVNRLVPLPSGVRAVRVFVSGQHSCVLSDELRVYCWGANIDAQLGRPNVLKRVPLAIDATPIGFSLGAVALSLTDDSTCALLVSELDRVRRFECARCARLAIRTRRILERRRRQCDAGQSSTAPST
jgi:hypothetical protein